MWQKTFLNTALFRCAEHPFTQSALDDSKFCIKCLQKNIIFFSHPGESHCPASPSLFSPTFATISIIQHLSTVITSPPSFKMLFLLFFKQPSPILLTSSLVFTPTLPTWFPSTDTSYPPSLCCSISLLEASLSSNSTCILPSLIPPASTATDAWRHDEERGGAGGRKKKNTFSVILPCQWNLGAVCARVCPCVSASRVLSSSNSISFVDKHLCRQAGRQEGMRARRSVYVWMCWLLRASIRMHCHLLCFCFYLFVLSCYGWAERCWRQHSHWIFILFKTAAKRVYTLCLLEGRLHDNVAVYWINSHYQTHATRPRMQQVFIPTVQDGNLLSTSCVRPHRVRSSLLHPHAFCGRCVCVCLEKHRDNPVVSDQ